MHLRSRPLLTAEVSQSRQQSVWPWTDEALYPERPLGAPQSAQRPRQFVCSRNALQGVATRRCVPMLRSLPQVLRLVRFPYRRLVQSQASSRGEEDSADRTPQRHIQVSGAFGFPNRSRSLSYKCTSEAEATSYTL